MPTSKTCIPRRRATCTAVVNFPIPLEPLSSVDIGISNVRASGISAAWDSPRSCMKARGLPRPASEAASESESRVSLGPLHKALVTFLQKKSRATHSRRSKHLVFGRVQSRLTSPESLARLPSSPVHRPINRDEYRMDLTHHLLKVGRSQRLSQ